jgi:hypothetical protein
MTDATPAESALSPLLHALTMTAGGASAQPAAGCASAEPDVPAASEPSLLLHALASDPLRAIVQLLGDANLPCFRLVCRAFRDHSSPAQMKCRKTFLRTRALTVFAWESMPGFVANLPFMIRLAASVGSEDVLEELVDNRQCALTAGACEAAAAEGLLDALAWLRSRGCPWGVGTCYQAARGAHLEVLRYAHEQGCPWGSATCWRAARGGHLEVLQYAHEHGSPWDSWTCFYAATRGHLERCCGTRTTSRAVRSSSAPVQHAAEEGHIELLRYAHEHGSPWDTHVFRELDENTLYSSW